MQLGVCTVCARSGLALGLVVAGRFWCSYAWVSLTQTAPARPRACLCVCRRCVRARACVCVPVGGVCVLCRRCGGGVGWLGVGAGLPLFRPVAVVQRGGVV